MLLSNPEKMRAADAEAINARGIASDVLMTNAAGHIVDSCLPYLAHGGSAAVFCGYIVSMLQKRRWNRVLFAPTGALLSPTSTLQKESIPGICHALCISNERE